MKLTGIIQSPWIRWSFFIVCLSGVLYGNFKPSPPEQVFAHSDKAGHLVSLMLLGISARLAMYRIPWYLLWATLMAFSFLLEYLQGTLRPLRTFSMNDSYANITGVVIAMLVMALWRFIAPSTLPKD